MPESASPGGVLLPAGGVLHPAREFSFHLGGSPFSRGVLLPARGVLHPAGGFSIQLGGFSFQPGGFPSSWGGFTSSRGEGFSIQPGGSPSSRGGSPSSRGGSPSSQGGSPSSWGRLLARPPLCEQNDRQVQKYYLGQNFVSASKYLTKLCIKAFWRTESLVVLVNFGSFRQFRQFCL